MQIDHLELLVPNRDAAQAWYGEWLGFVAMSEHAEWAQDGPLMLTNDGGITMLALFTGSGRGRDEASKSTGWRRIAFRMSGAELLAWTQRYRQSGQTLKGPVDHDKAWSVYFSDPWGNALEVTTYDYSMVRQAWEAGQ
jgi:catechol-2,3-dioxygenase